MLPAPRLQCCRAPNTPQKRSPLRQGGAHPLHKQRRVVVAARVLQTAIHRSVDIPANATPLPAHVAPQLSCTGTLLYKVLSTRLNRAPATTHDNSDKGCLSPLNARSKISQFLSVRQTQYRCIHLASAGKPGMRPAARPSIQQSRTAQIRRPGAHAAGKFDNKQRAAAFPASQAQQGPSGTHQFASHRHMPETMANYPKKINRTTRWRGSLAGARPARPRSRP